jgi:2-C-methyl-D-erythritol 4-phosphate cytidylyltransferase
MTNIAVILAGGSGHRFGGDLPKQFLNVAGKTILEHSVDAFERNAGINEICIVVHPDYVSLLESIVLHNRWSKVTRLLKGGDERYLSSMAAIEACRPETDVCLVFHDAVRPLVSQRIINDVITALDDNKAVAVAVPATDTILERETGSSYIGRIPDRRTLMYVQTPQAFRYETIAEAYRIGLQDKDFQPTDDCGVVRKYLPQERIYIVEGDDENIKLTYPKDSWLVERILAQRDKG